MTLRYNETRWFSAARASGLTKLRTTPVSPSHPVAVFTGLEVLSTQPMRASVRISRGVESLFGTRDENIRLFESGLGVHTQLVDSNLEIEGEAENVTRAESILEDYAALGGRGCWERGPAFEASLPCSALQKLFGASAYEPRRER